MKEYYLNQNSNLHFLVESKALLNYYLKKNIVIIILFLLKVIKSNSEAISRFGIYILHRRIENKLPSNT